MTSKPNKAGYIRVMFRVEDRYSPYYRYFDPEQRAAAVKAVVGGFNNQVTLIVVNDSTDPNRKYNQELNRGYYDRDKAAKYFSDGCKKRITESTEAG